MKIDFKIEGIDSEMALLRLYEKYVRKSIEDGVREMAMSTTRSLAMKVQPYGLSEKIGARFEKNIGREIDFVAYSVRTDQAFGARTIEDAHMKMRRNGSVRIRRIRQAAVTNPIPQGEIEQYKRKQIAKAGRAKAGWLDCALQLGGKLSGVGAWIKRHANGKWGRVSGVGTKKISMTNLTPYLTGPQSAKSVRSALEQGRKNGLKFIAKQVRGAIKKAEKTVLSATKAQYKTISRSQKIAEKAWNNRFKLPPKTK